MRHSAAGHDAYCMTRKPQTLKRKFRNPHLNPLGMRRWLLVVCACMLGLVLSSCDEAARSVQRPRPVPSLIPTLPVAPPPLPGALTPSVAAPSDTGWLEAGAGIALRRLRVPYDDGLAPVSVVRIDPALVRFRVGYAPDQPPGLSTWHSESGALATINGGFFDAHNQSTALVISDGMISGSSYEGLGGMFAVDTAGNVSLRYLAEQPYDPNEPLAEALQSWPMLIKPGGTLAYTSADDGQRARRSVVAIDRSGKVLLIACASSAFTLRGLADWLLSSDLEIDAALNLDGGSSTGLYLQSDGQFERVDAFVPLPIALLVLPE